MNTKIIEITKSTICDGFNVAEGELVEASLSAANYLIATGKARHAPEADVPEVPELDEDSDDDDEVDEGED